VIRTASGQLPSSRTLAELPQRVEISFSGLDRSWRDSAALRAVNRVIYAPAVRTWIFSAISMAAVAPSSGLARLSLGST
jgi:hypothetical protein